MCFLRQAGVQERAQRPWQLPLPAPGVRLAECLVCKSDLATPW